MVKDEEKLKETLKHCIDLELYANGVYDEIEESLVKLYGKIDGTILANDYISTKKSYGAINSVLDETYKEYENELKERLNDEAEKVKEQEQKFLKYMYGTALVLSAVTAASVLFTPFDDKDTIKTFSERSIKNIKRTYDTALRSGYMFGQKAEDVVSQARKSLKTINNGIHNGVITAVPGFAKTTDRIIFQKNNIEVVWVSTLDGKTCLYCASLSGKKFASVSAAPTTPHDLCRCVLMPAQFVDEVPDFKGFINSLTEDEQKEVLGANRFKMWKEYDVSLDKFLNDGRVVPLKDLDTN